jgi:hypothetical protein
VYPQNYEALTVIPDVTSDDGSRSPGRLQEVGINHIDYERCNDLHDGDIVYSVMLCDDGDIVYPSCSVCRCAGMPGAGEVAKATLRSYFRSSRRTGSMRRLRAGQVTGTPKTALCQYITPVTA